MRGLKIGVIGAGSMGKHHSRIANLLPGTSLVWIADPNPAVVSDFSDILKPLLVPDYLSLLSEVNAVIIATPASTHFQITQECLHAGKHVFLEKPLTGSSALARNLAALAKEKNLLLAAGFIERFNPAFQQLIREIKGQKIIGIDIKRLSPFPERITDANVITDMMLHDLDLLCLLVNDEIESIIAKGEKIRTSSLDRVTATISYKTGIICRIEGSRVFGSRTRKICITTDKNIIDSDLLNKSIYLRDFSSPTPSTYALKNVDQITEELTDFIDAIKGRRQLSCPVESVLKALELAERIEQSC